jgi:DNA ligase (NAD+)
LEKDELSALEGFGEKKAQNIIDAVENSKKRGLAEFIYALGIPNVGKATANDLANRYESVGAFALAGVEELSGIRDIGNIVADGIVRYFADKTNAAELQKLKDYGVDPRSLPQTGPGEEGILAGRIVVFTGSLSSMSRVQAAGLAKRHGAEISNSISRKVNLVVAGEKAGEKLEKAEEMNIEIISEESFIQMISNENRR